MARRGAAMRSRCPRLLAVVLGSAALLLGPAAFVAPGGVPARAAMDVARQASFGEGAGSRPTLKKKSLAARVSKEDLRTDHGDRWELVEQVLRTKRAESPEAMMRARFTALRYKDPVFLAATERDESLSREQRAKDWAVTLGIKEKSFIDSLMMMGLEDIQNLAEAESFEVVSASGPDVEFKIRCAGGKTLHEKSSFKTDKNWGWVYTGESSLSQWE